METNRNSRNMSFDQMDAYEGKRTKFFSLKNDGDTAIVRFYHDTGDDIQKLPVHTVMVGERKIKVACLRMPDEPEDNCPLCEAGELVSPKMFIKILVYSPDKSGMYTLKPELQVWERGKSFRKQLQSLINRYAANKPLMNTVFEIERCGEKGSNKTTYQIYKADEIGADECLLPNKDDIEDFDALGTIVKDKTYDEMNEYLETGEFPKTNKDDSGKLAKHGDSGVSRRPERRQPAIKTEEDEEVYEEDEESIAEEPVPARTGRRVLREPEDSEQPARPRRSRF